MATPNQQLTELICAALGETKIVNEREAELLKACILSGKIKAEDWYGAVENSLPRKSGEVSNGD